MGLFDLIVNTAVRVVVAPVAIAHDVVTGLGINAPSMTAKIIGATVDDAKETLRETTRR